MSKRLKLIVCTMPVLLSGMPAIANKLKAQVKCNPEVMLCFGDRPPFEEIVDAARVCFFTSLIQKATSEIRAIQTIRETRRVRMQPSSEDGSSEGTYLCNPIGPILMPLIWDAPPNTDKKHP